MCVARLTARFKPEPAIIEGFFFLPFVQCLDGSSLYANSVNIVHLNLICNLSDKKTRAKEGERDVIFGGENGNYRTVGDEKAIERLFFCHQILSEADNYQS
jgi:hypothetical protein